MLFMKKIIILTLVVTIFTGCSDATNTIENKITNPKPEISLSPSVPNVKLSDEQQQVYEAIKQLVKYEFSIDNSYVNERYPDSIKILSTTGNYIVQHFDKDNLLSEEFPPYMLIDENNKAFLLRNKELVPYDSIKEQVAQKKATMLDKEIVLDLVFKLNEMNLGMAESQIEKIIRTPIEKVDSEVTYGMSWRYKDYWIGFDLDKVTSISYKTVNLDFGQTFLKNFNGLIYLVDNNSYAFYNDTDNSILFVSYKENTYDFSIVYSDGNFIGAISDGTYKLIRKEEVIFK